MSSTKSEKIVRFHVAGIPIIRSLIDRLGIRLLLTERVPSNGNESLPVADSLQLLIYNITIGRDPLYELQEWALRIAPFAFGITADASAMLNDDRFGRALDKIYDADRASLMTSVVIKMIKKFDLDTNQIHNDSTTVKACGKIPGMTKCGFKLAYGKSKDHRPDLKQLLLCLTISKDGGVPIHFKLYPGNRSDDTTHIETWQTLTKILARKDFLYVADCKVCTHKQLSEIVGNGGRVVSIIPKTWKEVKDFKEVQKATPLKPRLIWKRPVPNHPKRTERFFVFPGDHFTYTDHYKIHWILSSEKQKNDEKNREEILSVVEEKLADLRPKLNKYRLKTKEQIQRKIADILDHYKIKDLLRIDLDEKRKVTRKQIGKGRPGPTTQYHRTATKTYSLSWERNEEIISQEKNLDGLFPLISTDTTLTAKEVLKAYKYQPHLEKRFTQLKSIHEAAPLLFKKIERVESIMFLYFVALLLQALIERTIRTKMKEENLKFLRIYPESRKSPHPTTAQIFRLFEGVSYYQLREDGLTTKEFHDDLTKEQKQILHLLEIPESVYWNKSENTCF